MNERDLIRIIIMGDLSKYHFLKELISTSSWEEIWHKQHHVLLVDRSIEVTSNNFSGENTALIKESKLLLNGRVPRGSKVVYHSVENELKDTYTLRDQIVYIDEFPFRESSLVQKIRTTVSDFPLVSVSVVLYFPERKGLHTDLTSVESAAKDAIDAYAAENLEARIHIPGSRPDFLFWRAMPYYEIRRQELESMLNALKTRLKKYFVFDQELLSFDMSSIFNTLELERLIRYNADLKDKNVFEIFAARVIKSHLDKENSDFMRSVSAVYEETVSSMKVWSRERDQKALSQFFKQKWVKYIEASEKIYFRGAGKDEYYQFLLETKAGFQFKIALSDFMTKKVPALLEEYITKNINFFEEIMHEE